MANQPSSFVLMPKPPSVEEQKWNYFIHSCSEGGISEFILFSRALVQK